MKKNFINLLVAATVLCACKSSSVQKQETKLKQQRMLTPEDSLLVQQQQSGVDLTASGNEPTPWHLSMDFEKQIVFTGRPGEKLITTPVSPETAEKFDRYQTKANGQPMDITLYHEPCEGKNKGRKVEVTVNNTRYFGCGQYLFNAALHDSWTLESINGAIQEKTAYGKGLPILFFDLVKLKLNGNDGCNAIVGKIEIRGNRMWFKNLAGTQMACTGQLFTGIFNKTMNDKPMIYYLKNDKLILELIDDSRIVFTKTR